jgi:hypothetical protein
MFYALDHPLILKALDDTFFCNAMASSHFFGHGLEFDSGFASSSASRLSQ